MKIGPNLIGSELTTIETDKRRCDPDDAMTPRGCVGVSESGPTCL